MPGELQDFTIDQFAGSAALILGSVGGLLMIVWKSRCMCTMNCCYLFQCERQPAQEPDSDEELPIVPAVDDGPPPNVP